MEDGCLITGGAGFIGRRLAARLAARQRVVVFDSLHPQVHGDLPDLVQFPRGVTFIRGDVRDRADLRSALVRYKPRLIYHLAAETGTGQSFDEIGRYCEVNVLGTSNLIDAIRATEGLVARVVLASSRAVYGEGPYADEAGRVRLAAPRKHAAMASGDFLVRAESGGSALSSVPSRAEYGVAPTSIYGSTKLMQEYLLQQASVGSSWTTSILRFQNVYGPGQSLRNPYTGVLSIFCGKLAAGEDIEVFEDGQIVRDFVFVDDVVSAMVAAGSADLATPAETIDIGSGTSSTILDVAQTLLRHYAPSRSKVFVSGRFRTGDIRAATASIEAAHRCLGWSPTTPLEKGLTALVDWARRSD